MGAWGDMPLGELLLDPGLTRQQPIHRVVQVIFIGGGHSQFLGQGGRVPEPCRAELRARMDQPLGNHR